MKWFRLHRVFGAQAALFALVVQFTLAFGHVHVGNADARAIAPAATAFNVTPDEPIAPTPSDHDQNSADGLCAICVTIHLTGAAQVAVAPALPLPVNHRLIELSLSSEATRDDLRCIDLRSRGPPQA
jgi:uncharacterized iron-regulated membrane protein